MRTDEWGPMIWTWLHAATLSRDRINNNPLSGTLVSTYEQDRAIGQIIVLLQCTMPCQLCRKNLTLEITQINDSKGHHVKDFEARVLRGEVFPRSRLECILHCLHNSVNKRLQKPLFPIEKLGAKYSSIPVEVLDVNLMQFLNAVVYVSSVDGLRRDKHVVALLYAFMSAFPFEWRIDSLLYQALVGSLTLASRQGRHDSSVENSSRDGAVHLWRSVLSALINIASINGPTTVTKVASDLIGAWHKI